MATRRPTDTSRSADIPKEIPKVIKADEPVTRPTRPAPPTRPRKAAPVIPATVSQEVRRGMIAEAAYLRAERRGFAPGHEREDWLAAELEVDALLKARHRGPSQ